MIFRRCNCTRSTVPIVFPTNKMKIKILYRDKISLTIDTYYPLKRAEDVHIIIPNAVLLFAAANDVRLTFPPLTTDFLLPDRRKIAFAEVKTRDSNE